MKIPEPQNTIVAMIDKYHADKQELPRAHLGCSLLGQPCDRWIWLSFRWAVIEKFPGRIMRLFRRGHNEEATVVSDLRAAGLDVRNTGHNQLRVDFGNHVSGSIDGIIYSGVPEAPKTHHVLEVKTHSKKSFDDVVKNGVEKSKPKHYVQMQLYMAGTKLERALYLSVCKDNDEIYTERVRYVKEVADKYIARGKRIALSDRIPEPISTDETWWECRFCSAHKFCHQTKTTEHTGCRTCAHSTAKEDSTWRCERYEADGIPIEHQHKGCEAHVLHPDLVPWKRLESANAWTAVYEIEGKRIENGDPCANVFSSKELLANLNACLHQDEFIEEVRVELGGRVVA